MAVDILIVEEITERVVIVEQGEQGVPGDSGTSTITLTAGEAVGGRRMVVINGSGEAVYADQSITDHANRVLGMTTQAASLGAPVTIQSSGEFTEPTWTWALDNPIFLGANGQLTQTVPATGVTLQVATPISATTIIIGIKMPYIRT